MEVEAAGREYAFALDAMPSNFVLSEADIRPLLEVVAVLYVVLLSLPHAAVPSADHLNI